MTGEEYVVTHLAKFFHSFPHVDLTFSTNNGSFNLENVSYTQSLGFWVAVPILWCLLNLVFFTLYACCRCCSQRNDKDGRILGLRVLIGIFIIISIIGIGFGFYGNVDSNQGVKDFTEAAEDIDGTILNIQSELDQQASSVNTSLKQGLASLQHEIKVNNIPENTLSQIQPAINELLLNSKQIQERVKKIHKDSSNVDIKKSISTIKNFEEYRFWFTMVLLIIEIIVSVSLFIPLVKRMKRLLLFFSGLMVINVLICWILTGIFLGFSIATGDFCVDPHNVTERMLRSDSHLDPDVVDYYLKCLPTDENPYGELLTEAQTILTHSRDTLKNIMNLVEPYLDTSRFQKIEWWLKSCLKNADDNIIQTITYTSCTPIRNDYMRALRGLCKSGLAGMAFLLLSMVGTALCFTILVLMSCRASKFMTKSSHEHDLDLDLDDGTSIPFIARSPPDPHYLPNKKHVVFSQQSNTDPMAVPGRSTPPPTYADCADAGNNAGPLLVTHRQHSVPSAPLEENLNNTALYQGCQSSPVLLSNETTGPPSPYNPFYNPNSDITQNEPS